MKREKRILLLMPEYILGGAETQLRYFIEYAETQKWKVDVIIEHELNKDDAVLKKTVLNMNSVRFYELGGGRECGKLYVSIILRILRNMIHTKYSACLIHYLPDLTLAPFIRFLGIHVVYSERIDAAGIKTNKRLQRCLNFCSCIFANSRYAKEELEEITGRKVRIIRNGKPVVSQYPLKSERKINRILVPARISPEKNQMLLLHYLKKYPNFDGKVVFAGLELDKTYQNKMKQFINKNNLYDRVELIGHVQNMEEEYEKADLIILPSLAEGTPNVVLEAYAYGRPVIVSDIGVERDIVTNPSLRFGVKNPDEINACIKYIEELPNDLYRKILQRNRKIVLRNYDVERMAKSFYRVLTK